MELSHKTAMILRRGSGPLRATDPERKGGNRVIMGQNVAYAGLPA